MTATHTSTKSKPPTENDADFYESVLRERSPLTGELPLPRYSIIPTKAPTPNRDKKTHNVGTPIKRAWPFAAAAILLLVLIAALSIGNSTSADAPQKDESQKKPASDSP